MSRTLFHDVVAGLEGIDTMDIKGIPIIYLIVPSQHLPGGNEEKLLIIQRGDPFTELTYEPEISRKLSSSCFCSEMIPKY